MPYATLIDALLEEGRTKSEAIVRQAQVEAERLLNDAQQQCETLDREADAAIRRSLSTQRAVILSSAALSARHVMLRAKREILDAVWRHVSQKATTLTGHARTAVLSALLDEILTASSSQSPRVLIDGRERPYLEEILTERSITFEEQHQDDLLLGIRLEGNGEVLTNCLAARLAKAKPELTIELNRLLFIEETVGARQ
ncbi:MAG: V-type ATP synthase subunit E [Nitrospira sp.]|nr:V-type ATP synthase subunit E [Nitrospira sp.]